MKITKTTFPTPFQKNVTILGFITLHYTLMPETPAEMKACIDTWKRTGKPFANI